MFKPAHIALGVALAVYVAPALTSAQVVASASAVTTATVNHAGEKLYKSACFVCHGTGAANAPKLGDKTAWAPIIAQGMDTILATAIKGKGAMPPRGGAAKVDDATLASAVEYMVKSSQ